MYFIKCILYLLVICIMVFFIGRLFPRRWINENKFPFKSYHWEKNGKIYDKLAIKKWKTKLPDASIVLHRIIPKLYPKKIVDKIISVDDNDAICMAQKLKKELGLNVGISSGANFLGAVLSNVDKIITVFPDDDTKYYSTDLANESLKSDIVDEIKLLYFDIKK